jgi:hypothetical protein
VVKCNPDEQRGKLLQAELHQQMKMMAQPEISSTPNISKKLAIHSEGAYSARTSRLIAWCKANDDALHIKLFLDSVKDAKDQGRKKKPSATTKETYYSQLANFIFLLP